MLICVYVYVSHTYMQSHVDIYEKEDTLGWKKLNCINLLIVLLIFCISTINLHVFEIVLLKSCGKFAFKLDTKIDNDIIVERFD